MECNLVLLNAKFGRWGGSERDTSAITTVGQVVTAGAELMRIVPDDASLEIEAYLPNQDIGFVSPGRNHRHQPPALFFALGSSAFGRTAFLTSAQIPKISPASAGTPMRTPT